MYCATCAANKMPQKGGLFVTIGRGKQKYQVRQVENNGRFGFTPHIIQKTQTIAGYVHFTAYCALEDCGCKLEFNEDTGKYSILMQNVETHSLKVKEWNALVQYTNDEDYWLG